MSDQLCLDCKVDTYAINEYYTVHDEVWLLANPDDHGMLCIGCLEERLGRALTPDDFPVYAINHGEFEQSDRLRWAIHNYPGPPRPARR